MFPRPCDIIQKRGIGGFSMSDDRRYLPSDELLEKIFFYMQQLFSEKELSGTLFLLTELGRTLVNSDRASFWFHDSRTNTLWTMAATGVGRISVPDDTGLIGASVTNNEILIVNNPYNDPRFNPAVDRETGYVTKSILTMPVTDSDGEVIGAFQAVNKITLDGQDDDFNEHDVKRLSLASAFCGRSLESFLLYNESVEDPLTGLKNRRGFFSHFEKHIVPVIGSVPTAMIICDIDHFKNVNDTYGHNAGDAVLRRVARLFSSRAGENDGVFRWGGEEFMFLLPGKTLPEAVTFAEEVRKAVEADECVYMDPFKGELRLRITMSFGVCIIDPTLGIDENVKIADDRLYYAKDHGRNMVQGEIQ